MSDKILFDKIKMLLNARSFMFLIDYIANFTAKYLIFKINSFTVCYNVDRTESYHSERRERGLIGNDLMHIEHNETW